MQNLSINMAKAYLGKNVNLHLKDGSVIINVQLTEIQKKGKTYHKNKIGYITRRKNRQTYIPLNKVAYARQLNSNLITKN